MGEAKRRRLYRQTLPNFTSYGGSFTFPPRDGDIRQDAPERPSPSQQAAEPAPSSANAPAPPIRGQGQDT